MKNVVWTSALWLLGLALPALGWAAAPLATVTIADGEAVMIREATRLQLAEGVRLAPGDLIEATTKTRFLRIEFADGLILDLGPESRAVLAPKFSGDRARLAARFGLLKGVLKLTVPTAPSALPPTVASFATPAFDVTGVARSAVFIVQAGESFAFAESGNLSLQERVGGKPAAATTTVRNGEFFARVGEAKSAITPRPTPAFIQRLPRPFLDTLPSRAALFKAREVEPKVLGPLVFADAEDWIDAEGLRPYFLARWKALARDPAFREGVAANLRAHPEWDRILYPEKYQPKPPSATASYQTPRQGSTY
ncbi:MAG TPA: hypothetical protein VFL64_11360 [Rhizobacter sp.]|nr:hypothetical protein [Rhizobacter sp.]